MAHARAEARLAELGTTPSSITDGWIADALMGVDDWALIGGPPCQAYSIAGRARMSGNADFKEDKRHFLYKEKAIPAGHLPVAKFCNKTRPMCASAR